jgi:O-antigen ligase
VRDALRRFPLERALQLAIALAIVTSVLAAGAILSWIEIARKLRWGALLVVLALALAYARRRRGGPVPRGIYGAALVFLLLTALSAAWSPVPGLTLARSAALALLFTACGALAYAAAGRADAIRRLLYGVLAGSGAVAIGGLLVLLFEHDRAVAPATTSLPARYQGLGGGPDTATMVLAVGTPIAAYALVESKSRLGRASAFGLLVLLLGSIVASGSRGALAAAFAGLLAFAVLAARSSGKRALAGAGVTVLFATAVLVMRLPEPADAAKAEPSLPATSVYVTNPAPGYLDADKVLRLQDDVGRPPWGVADTERRPRTLLGTSGRTEAWRGALAQGAERPLLGYGFGTEDRVFIDRYVSFNSNSIESSYIGLFLQLGLAGVGAFAVLVVVLARPVAAALRPLDAREARVVAASAGGLVVGLVLGLVQSYIYAVGNNATAAVWICAFLLAATRRVSHEPADDGAVSR